MSRTSHASALAFAAMVLGTAIESPAATNSFYDFENFEDNAIDRSVWSDRWRHRREWGAVTIACNDSVKAMMRPDWLSSAGADVGQPRATAAGTVIGSP
jgi:hypothetical protein